MIIEYIDSHIPKLFFYKSSLLNKHKIRIRIKQQSTFYSYSIIIEFEENSKNLLKFTKKEERNNRSKFLEIFRDLSIGESTPFICPLS